jgi:hypothetical protein
MKSIAVDHGLVGERLECSSGRRKTRSEVFAVAREQSDPAVGLHAERAVAVELRLLLVAS